MLSVWKRTWKEKDPPTTSSQNKMDEPGNSASIQGCTVAAHPSVIASSTLQCQKKTIIKRRHSATGMVPDPSKKRLRFDVFDPNPELDMIHEVIRRQNTLVILSQETSKSFMIVQFLVYSIKHERLQHNTLFKRPRTILLVVNDDSSVNDYSDILQSMAPELSVDKFNAASGISGPWASLLSEDIVVLTSKLLLESLRGDILTMTQIHTLVFVDVWNVPEQKMVASIQQIMNDFFFVTDRLNQPRIFGFAMPAPGYDDLSGCNIAQVEAIMDSKVLDLRIQSLNGLPSSSSHHEIVLFYKGTMHPTKSALSDKLQSLDPSGHFFLTNLGDSRDVLLEVGCCASDLVWRRALKKVDIPHKATTAIEVMAAVQQCIKDWPFVLPNLDPTSQAFNVTNKFLMLVKALHSCEPYGKEFRGIIIVERHIIALAIADLITKLDDQKHFLRLRWPISDETHSVHDQDHKEIWRLFTAGVYNLLIVTKLDEDVDLSRTSVVICFNSPESLTFHGTIGEGNRIHVIHMIEDGLRRRSLTNPNAVDLIERHTIQSTSALLLSAPQSARAIISETDEDEIITSIQDPTTGNRIYHQNAVEAVSRIGASRYFSSEEMFHFEEQSDLPATYTCTVTVPGFIQLIGPPRSAKDDAKRVACFRVCKTLFFMGILDCRFFPPQKYSNIRVSGEKATYKEQMSVGARSYLMKEPDFWANTKGNAATSLYPLVISTAHIDEDMRPYAPIVMLTRQPLPDLESIKVFFAGVPVIVRVQRAAPIHIDESQLHDLYLYTVRVCRIISNKAFDCTLASMAYFLAPLTLLWISSEGTTPNNSTNLPSIADYIAWNFVKAAIGGYITSLKTTTPEEAETDIQDAIIQDRSVEFTRRYVAIRLRPDLSPLDKPQDSVPNGPYESILDFCKARRQDFTGLSNENQPLVQVSTVPPVLNHLNPTSRPSPPSGFHAKFLIPELCAKCTIPASTLRTARLLPSVTRRIDDFLLVKELNAMLFDHAIKEKLLHMALCTPSCGVEYDYERLELLGDAFLKYISSIYLFVTHPTYTEGSLHVARQELISNKSLFNHARRAGVPAYIQSKLFSPKQWKAPNFIVAPTKTLDTTNRSMISGDVEIVESSNESISISLRQKVNDTENHITPLESKKKQRQKKRRRNQGEDGDVQWLGDKAIADVAEAMIGAGYITGGREIGLKVIKALGIPILNINTWSDFGTKAITAPPQNPTPKRASLEAVTAIIGHKLEQLDFLALALTHPSMPGHDGTLSERLEFLGDAILDFMVIRYLYDREQQLTPGVLTLLKGAMVSNTALAAICVCSGLHEHFFHKSHTLETNIQEYAAKVRATRDKEHQNAKKEGRPPGQFWLELSAPKVLSDIVESVMGAVYITDNFAPIGVEALFNKLLKPFYDEHITLKTLSYHPTKVLYELFQRQGCREYQVQNDKKEKGKDFNTTHIIVHDVVLATAEDLDPNIAARRASLFALDALEGDPGFFARTCACRITQMSKKEAAENEKRLRVLQDLVSDAISQESEEEGIILEDLAMNDPHNSELEDGMILE